MKNEFSVIKWFLALLFKERTEMTIEESGKKRIYQKIFQKKEGMRK